MTKAETEGIRHAVQAGLATLPEGTDNYLQFRKIGTSVLGQREYSMQASPVDMLCIDIWQMVCSSY
jgi:hypothetical protein